MPSASSLLHPVRLRIVQTLLGAADGLTTHELHERLTDVPIATLYRHVAHLVSHGLIDVAHERVIRGASEKSYRIAPGFSNPTAAELGAATPSELLTMFTVFTSGVIRDFDLYLRGSDPDLVADRVSFAQADFWATDDEVDAFLEAVMVALRGLIGNEPTDARRQRKLTTVLMPAPTTTPGPPPPPLP